jgi:hypothetical protein
MHLVRQLYHLIVRDKEINKELGRRCFYQIRQKIVKYFYHLSILHRKIRKDGLEIIV